MKELILGLVLTAHGTIEHTQCKAPMVMYFCNGNPCNDSYDICTVDIYESYKGRIILKQTKKYERTEEKKEILKEIK